MDKKDYEEIDREIIEKLTRTYDEPAKKNRPGHPLFYETVEKMMDIHAVKNRDYGNGNPLGNFMGCAAFGVSPFLGVLVRMSDKWSRIQSLVKNGMAHVKDESIEDTLIDLANYAILALVVKRETEGK